MQTVLGIRLKSISKMMESKNLLKGTISVTYFLVYVVFSDTYRGHPVLNYIEA